MFRNKKCFTVLLLALAVCLATFPLLNVYAVTGIYYVDSALGDDSNIGDIDYPYKTIGKALSEAINGDTIYLAGEFREDLIITKEITLNAAPDEQQAKLFHAPNIVSSSSRHAVITVRADNVNIENLFIDASIDKSIMPGPNGRNHQGIRVVGVEDVQILNCSIEDSGENQRNLCNGGVYIEGSSNILLKACNFSDMQGAVSIGDLNYSTASNNVTVENCSISDCAWGIGIGDYYDSRDCKVIGCTVDVSGQALSIRGNGALIEDCKFTSTTEYDLIFAISSFSMTGCTLSGGAYAALQINGAHDNGIYEDILISDCTISGFGREGINFANLRGDSTITIKKNTITGSGQNNISAQNGITILDYDYDYKNTLNVVVEDNTISNINYTGTNNSISFGIYVWNENGSTLITKNKFNNCLNYNPNNGWINMPIWCNKEYLGNSSTPAAINPKATLKVGTTYTWNEIWPSTTVPAMHSPNWDWDTCVFPAALGQTGTSIADYEFTPIDAGTYSLNCLVIDGYGFEYVNTGEDVFFATITVVEVIDATAILGVKPPVEEETPVTTITANDQYTGAVTWSPNHSPFAFGVTYTATINLTPADGYTLDGVPENFFTVDGATSISNEAGSGVIKAVFPATTPLSVVNIKNIQGVAPPVAGETPIIRIADTDEYSGTVVWNPVGIAFGFSTVYTATITLSPKKGYSLIGVAPNFFIVPGADSVSNDIHSGVIKAIFPATRAEPGGGGSGGGGSGSDPPPKKPTTENSSASPTTKVEVLANALHDLGLFKGTDTGVDGNPIYDLDKPLTRMQALILTIRLLGLEKKALAYSGANPFSDISGDDSHYAAFAFASGITNGIGGGLFDPNSEITCQQFTAFLLRVLGFSEKNGDFDYEETLNKALSVMLYSQGDLNDLSSGVFLRGDAVAAMIHALLTSVKDSDSIDLLDTLVESGVITQAQADAFKDAVR
jgi:hypothetical protein